MKEGTARLSLVMKKGTALAMKEGRPLLMYLTVGQSSMGSILGQDDESGRRAILLPQQEVHRLRNPLQRLGKKLLCPSLGSSSTATLHAELHYHAHRKGRSFEVHILETIPHGQEEGWWYSYQQNLNEP